MQDTFSYPLTKKGLPHFEMIALSSLCLRAATQYGMNYNLESYGTTRPGHLCLRKERSGKPNVDDRRLSWPLRQSVFQITILGH